MSLMKIPLIILSLIMLAVCTAIIYKAKNNQDVTIAAIGSIFFMTALIEALMS